MEIQKKWFAEETPVNAKSASATIGSGDNGVVTIVVDSVGTEGNDYTVAVVVADGINKALAASIVGTDITVTLGTDASGDADATKNTAKLIAEKISTIAGVTATYSGTGATAITVAITKKSLAGGQYGTVAIVPYTWLYIGTTYYVNIAPNSKYDANWRTVTFTAY